MSPTEKLIENIIDIVHATQNTPDDEKLAHLVKLLLATLKTHYAIGRWVSVEERLPEKQKTVIVKWSDGGISYYVYHTGKQWSMYSHQSCVTHWLDLDMPSGKEEEA